MAELTRSIDEENQAAQDKAARDQTTRPAPVSGDPKTPIKTPVSESSARATEDPAHPNTPPPPTSGPIASASEGRAHPSEGASPRRSFTAPIAVGVVALAVIGAGLGTTLSVGPELQALQDRCQGLCAPSEADPLRARTYAGYGLMAAGGALVIVDAVLFGLAARRPAAKSATAVRLSPLAGPSFAGVRMAGAFQ